MQCIISSRIIEHRLESKHSLEGLLATFIEEKNDIQNPKFESSRTIY